MLRDFSFRSYRTLIVAAVLFGATGAIHLFEPLDLTITALANKIRLHDASGEIVVVGIDDYAIEHDITGSLPPEHAANLLDSLLGAGARTVVLSEPVISRTEGDADRLEALLEAHPDQLFVVQPVSGPRSRNKVAGERFVRGPVGVHNEKNVRYWGAVEQIAYALEDAGQALVSAESALAGVYGQSDEQFPIDYSIDANSIPSVTFSAKYANHLIELINGKDLVVGYDNLPIANGVSVPGQRAYGRGFPLLIALGAETLNQGRPKTLGWFWSLAAALAFAWYILGVARIRAKVLVFSIGILTALCAVPLFNSFSITLVVGNAIVLLLVITPISISRAWKAKTVEANAVHPDSGLASVNVLRLGEKDSRALVVASVSRFEELMGVLSQDDRKALSARISALATPDGQIWHGESGRFYWFVRPEQAQRLTEHLEGLALILRNGFSVGDLPVSLHTVFGVDLRGDARLSDRILGANLSATRAAAMGKHWLAYEEGDKTEATWSITRLRELDLALQAGQIRAHLQPKLDLETGQIIGAEALARWTHPIRGEIRPDEFVKAAEDGGRIKELTMAVMHGALAAAKPVLMEDPSFTVAVNISPSLLTDGTLCASISSVLVQHQVLGSNLVLEVTESTAFSDNDLCIRCMHDLVDMGIQLSIDDYGTGNSTLDYLLNIPARELKIDRKFVSQILTSDEDRTLVRSTIKLAQELNMTVVAEGVEDEATLEALREMGCDLVQGYLIAHPLNSEQFLQFMVGQRQMSKTINKM